MEKTAQQIFNKVVAHLRKQGCRSLYEYSGAARCAYRGSNGKRKNLRCAAGCLITNKDYDPKMEGRTVFSLVDDYSLVKRSSIKQIKKHVTLVRSLQSIHDYFLSPEWERQFERVALELKLIYTAP